MGKGSQQAPSGGEQRVVSLPDYADPYFKRLLQGAEEATMPFYPDDPDKYGDLAGKSTYQTYDGERLAKAGDYSDITDSREMIRGIAGTGIPGMTEAMGVQREGITGLRNLAENPTDFTASDFSATSVDPYSGFQAGSADPYAGFQAGSADPFSDFQQADFSKAQGTEFEFGPARQFTGQEVADYMDPYMQNVVDLQKREAIKDFDRQQAGRDASAVQAGAFGGSRQAVAQGMAEQNLQNRLGDIQQVGSQAAFDRAMQMFESDRTAQMDVEQRRADEAARVQGIDVGETGRTQTGTAAEMARTQAGRAAELARTQGIDIDEAARVQAAEASELARTQGIDLDEAARVQAAEAAELARTQGIDVSEQARVQAGDAAENARIQAAEEAQRMGTAGLYGNLMGAGAGLASLGERGRGASIQNAQLLEALGQGIRAEDQALLDMDYQDFLRQQDYPIRQYERFAGMLAGVPIQPDVYTQTYQSYNPTQQLLGAGLAGLGMYRGLA